jgi:hypothetical protein
VTAAQVDRALEILGGVLAEHAAMMAGALAPGAGVR